LANAVPLVAVRDERRAQTMGASSPSTSDLKAIVHDRRFASL
jgi:hypothetical protein